MQLSVKKIIDIVCQMRKYGCVVFGAGYNGKIAIEMLERAGMDVKAVFDSRAGKEVAGKIAQTISNMDIYNPQTVCIISPQENISDVHDVLSRHFNLVADMQIINWMKYMVPEENGSAFKEWKALCPFNYYESPYVMKSELNRYRETIDNWQNIQDIELNEEGQRSKLRQLRDYYIDYQIDLCNCPENFRYKEDNNWFSLADALLLHSMMRLHKPKRIIEIGSGYSTCVMLDTGEYYMDAIPEIICIEPCVDRLRQNLNYGDEERIVIYEQVVQDIPLETFQKLEAGDMIFIDSSHVARVGGDVLWEYFHILPSLQPGVIIHIHDMFYPFTYPLNWVYEGRAYNEAFIVQGMLTGSRKYKILIYNDMMIKEYGKEYSENWKRDEQPDGGSLWLQKEF